MIIKCNECEKDFEVNLYLKELDGELFAVCFDCNGCNKVYVSYIESNFTLSMLDQIKQYNKMLSIPKNLTNKKDINKERIKRQKIIKALNKAKKRRNKSLSFIKKNKEKILKKHKLC